MKRLIILLAAAMVALSACSRYDTVKGDPLQAKIYTLENGLRIYMTVNKDEPRIQTYIAVRSGGKLYVLEQRFHHADCHIDRWCFPAVQGNGAVQSLKLHSDLTSFTSASSNIPV